MPIRNYLGLILSICAGGAMFWSCSFEIEQMVVGELLTIPGGRYKFLTILNLYLQIFYYAVCIINFAFGTNTIELDKRSRLQKFRDFVFAGAAFPMGTFVSATFWGLYHLDRNLIFPEEDEKLLPPILNHIMHTLPAIAIWMENLFHYHRYPSRKSGLLCTLTLTAAYIVWIHYLHHIHLINSNISLWIYPILNELSFIYRCLFFLGSALFSIGLYLIGEMYTFFLTVFRVNPIKSNKKKI